MNHVICGKVVPHKLIQLAYFFIGEILMNHGENDGQWGNNRKSMGERWPKYRPKPGDGTKWNGIGWCNV